jgi:L-rhamnose 1-dehydrogenase
MEGGRVAVITGGGQGIGFGIAECFAERGERVVIADLDGGRAETAASLLRGRGAPGALGIPCDVADRASVEAAFRSALDRLGRIDVLVNNAGICPFQHIMEMSPETWQRTIDVNLTGAFHCTQVAARHMIGRGGGGSIVFITSLADHRTGPSQVDYCASKAGLMGAMTGFATALGPHGINCCAVAPGHVSTALTRHYWDTDAGRARVPEVIPMGRLGTPRDIGEAVWFLASDRGRYCNGITLRVDGGNAARA